MAETLRAAAPACAQLKRKAADKAAPALNHNAGADAASVALSPAELGVANCPWVGERPEDGVDFSGAPETEVTRA